MPASDRDDVLLAELRPKDIDRTPPYSECMAGTREDIFSRIDEWLIDLEAPNILWLKGHPGAGKSAIASSLVERLVRSRRLGSSFFFQRDNISTTTPNSLWRIVAFDLSRQYPGVRKRLVTKLREDEIRPTTINVESLFHHYIFEPLMESEEMPPGRLPVIVVDALDECGGLEGRVSMHRKNLVKTLHSWSKLPNKFKLVVTSRSEIDLEQVFQDIGCVCVAISTGEGVDAHSSNDIRVYLEHEFRNITSQYSMSLNTGWPGEQTIDELTKKAAGLFIWAKTVIKFIDMGAPRSQLKLISEGDGRSGIAELYSRLLQLAFPEQSTQSTTEFRSIFATIILAKRPLSALTLAKLLQVEIDVVENICIRMRSVLETKDTLRIAHQSFSDFLLDRKTCSPGFHVNLDDWKQSIAHLCLRTMAKQLRFNICELESSYSRNSEIPDLAFRIQTFISSELSYSCRFWAEHLSESTQEEKLYEQVQEFAKEQFLYWLEVMSLCKQVNLASGMLNMLINWIKVSFLQLYRGKYILTKT
jgi:hypothetical protein